MKLNIDQLVSRLDKIFKNFCTFYVFPHFNCQFSFQDVNMMNFSIKELIRVILSDSRIKVYINYACMLL